MFYSNTAIVVNNTIIVADADGAIESATVAITSGFQSTEDQLLFSSQNGIDGTYNVGSGVLTLSGTASDVDYQTALRSVQYNNTSATPDTNDRTITFQLSDGVTTSASVATSVTINKPPVIEAPAKDTQAGGNVAFSIDDIFSDPDDNLDLPTLTVTSKQGALVTIRNGFITVNYSTIPDFQGTDELTMSICDLAGKCQTQIVTVDIGAVVDVFNGVSANADGMNDFMRVKFLPPGTQVSIFNRWGDAVFETKDYDNNEVSKRFEGNGTDGNTLTAGTYFYKITLPDGRQRTGYLHLKR
jgi:gliding motility-associated-like protein